MRNRSDPSEEERALREQLIGLGEASHRKSYYPELQKRLEELERFKAFLDYSNDAIFLVEVPAGKIIDFNDASSRMTGWGPEELRHKSIFELSELAQSSQAKRLFSEGGEIQKGRALIETNLFRCDGGRIPAEMTLARMLFGESAYVIAVVRDIAKRKVAEEALWESEMHRLRLQTQLELAAKMQARLLPSVFPRIPGFEIAASCLPAYQVGGDFYDWQETGPGVYSVTLGDVMGKGMAAAMLMATVRASLRALSQANSPAEALRQAERALRKDLQNSESFVTLFHARLDALEHRLIYVDCGHGLVFMLHADGSIKELLPRGLPLGVLPEECFEEGSIAFGKGDTLVLFSDGLLDAMQQLELDKESLARKLWAPHNAQEMVDRLVQVMPSGAMPLDDMTVVVVRCTEEVPLPMSFL